MWVRQLVFGRTPFYVVSVNGLHMDRVRDRVSGRVRDRDRVRVRACHPDSSGNLLTWRKMEFAPSIFLIFQVVGLKNESVVTSECPQIVSIASLVQNELNSR